MNTFSINLILLIKKNDFVNRRVIIIGANSKKVEHFFLLILKPPEGLVSGLNPEDRFKGFA